MGAIVEIAHQDLSIKRLHLLLQISTFKGKLIIEGVVIVRLLGKSWCYFFSLGEFVNPDCFGIGLESLRVGELALLIIDEIDGTVVDESVEVEGDGSKNGLVGQEEDVIILGDGVIGAEVFLSSLVDIGIVF